MLALEPRLLFDGAAAATADQQQEQQAQQALAAATVQAASDSGDLPLSPMAEGGGAAPAGRELLVLDTRIPDWQALVGEVRPNVQVLLLDANADPLAQIAAAIGDQPVAGIHLLAHGDPGALRLGGLVLDREGVDRYATELARLGAGLAADGDILLYGCETGKGEAGRLLIEALARVTGADVAASTNLTGAARLGGDWVLEARAGTVDATAFASADALAAFDRLLALPVVDLNAPSVFIASDNFATQSYTGGTGWTSGWQEFDASPDGGGDSNNSPTGKNVQLVADGTGGFEAVFIGHGNQVPRDFVQRSLNLLPYTSATLSFTYRMAAVEAGDTVSVEVSTNGGASFTVVDVLPTSTTNVSRSYDISGLISDRMVIRFGTNTGFTNADDRFFFDNVVVTGDGNNFDASYAEDGTPANIAAATATVTDPDGSPIQGAVITIANLQAGDLLTPGALPPGITSSGAGTTITLSGLASAADYATAIRNITYSTTSDTPNTKVVREITVRVTDATGEQSNAARAFIRVANADDAMNAAPDAFDVASFGSFSGNVIADNGAGPDTDPDGTLTVSTTLVSAPTRGTVVMNADGTFTYSVNAGFVGTDFTDTFQYRLQSLSQVPGVTYQFWDSVPAGNSLATGFPTTPPDLTGFSTSYNVDIPALAFGGTNPLDNFTVRFSSELEVTTGGTYTFTTGSDDGSILRVDGVVVVSNDGAHSFQERSGSIFLAPGRYTLQVDFFEVGGQEDLQVYYQGPDTLGVRTDLDGAVGLLAPTYATGTVTVNGFAAAPRLDLDGSAAGTGFAPTWTDPPGNVQPIADTDVTITDTNSANLTGATVTLVNAQAGDVLIAGAMPGGISATVSGNVVTLSGTASLAAYQTALRAISFDNTDANPVTTTRTVNVVVTDGTYDSNTAVASIAIVSPNDAPTAAGDSVATLQNTPVAFDVRTNDSDPEAQPLAVTQVNGTAIAVGGTVTLAGVGTVLRNADGTLTFTPNAGYSGTSSFTYTVSDGSLTATATVNLAVNAPPTLDLDASAAGTGFTTTFTEGGTAVAVVDTDVAIGDPNAGDSITFATVTLLNAQPDDVLSIAGALPAGITAGLAGNVLTLSGTATRASYQTALQQVRFGNPGSTSGSARSVQVLVFDGASYSNAALATINVTAANDPPVNVVPAAQSTLIGTALAITGVSVSDVDGNLATSTVSVTGGTLNVSLTAGAAISAGANGSSTLTLSGTQAQINAALATLAYTPAAGFAGTATLTILSADTNGASDSDAVSIQIAGLLAADDFAATTEDAPVLVAGPGVLANDQNGAPQVAGGFLANYVVASDSTANDLWEDSAASGVNWDFGTGVLTKNTSPGSAYPGITQSYAVPNALGTGATAPALGDSELSASFELWFRVDGSVPASGNYLVFETGSNNNGFALVYDAQNNEIELHYDDDDNIPSPAALVVASLGALDPRAEFIQVVVTLDDANTASQLQLHVNGGAANAALGGITASGDVGGDIDWSDAGSGLGRANGTFENATGATVSALTGEFAIVRMYQSVLDAAAVRDSFLAVSGQDTLVVSAIEGNAAAVGAVYALASGALVTLNADGSFTYDPNGQFEALGATDSDTDSFTYTASDLQGNTDTATVTLTITGANDAPIANDDTASTNEDTALVLAAASLSANDTDVDGDALTVTSVGGAVGGTVSLAAGNITFTPTANYNGPASFAYTLSDGNGGTDTATVTLTVNPVNDAPIAVDDAFSGDEDTPLAGNVLANDTDVEGNALNATLVAGPANGALVLNADGSFTYTPNANFNGTDSFTYRVNDGTLDGNLATVTLTVNPVNDAPIANDDLASTPINAPVTIAVLANDADVEPGALTVNAATVAPAEGSVAINGDGTLTFTPALNYTGVATITYTVTDAGGLTDTATVTVNVGANTPPTGADATRTIGEDGSYTLLAADFGFADADLGQTLASVRVDTLPAAGALRLNGAAFAADTVISVADIAAGLLVFAPAADASGAPYASFTFSVQDSAGAYALAPSTFTLNVTAVNDAPVANPDTAGTAEDTPVSGNVLGNDTDVDGPALSVTQFTVAGVPGTFAAGATAAIPGVGTLTIAADGAYTFTPAPDYNGPGRVATYTVSDGSLSASGTLTITAVSAVNDPPVALDAAGAGIEDSPVRIVVALAGSDVDGTVVSYTLTSLPAGGQLFAAASGGAPLAVGSVVAGPVYFAPATDFNGVANFGYTATDDGGSVSANTATASITIAPVNDAPVAQDDTVSTAEDTPVNFDVRTNDSDVDSASLSVTEINASAVSAGGSVAVSGGSVTLNADGTLTFTPTPDFNGTPSFNYTVSDGALTSTATVNLAVTAVNDAPAISGDVAGTVTEGSAPTIGGRLVAVDPDAGESSFQSATGVTAFGTYTIDVAGTWTYALDSANPVVSALAEGEVLTDSFVVLTADGTVQRVTITIVGTSSGGDIVGPDTASDATPYVLVAPPSPFRDYTYPAVPGPSYAPPFAPADFVLRAVAESQRLRAEQARANAGIVTMRDIAEVRSDSLGSGIGLDRVLYVLPAVAEVQDEVERAQTRFEAIMNSAAVGSLTLHNDLDAFAGASARGDTTETRTPSAVPPAPANGAEAPAADAYAALAALLATSRGPGHAETGNVAATAPAFSAQLKDAAAKMRPVPLPGTGPARHAG
jgi:VCBS repeat-containing protein